MHTMWKGSISFGLVHIPIKLFAATENKSVSMRQLHKKCHTPIRYQKQCPSCETEVEQQDIVKGFEYEKGKFVVVEDEELKEIADEKSKTIDIVDFIELKEIDPIYYDRSYYLGPNENGEKAYTLLKNAMQETDKIAIAKFVLRAKEYLAAIRVYDQALVLETLHYPDEIRPVAHIPGLQEEVQVKEKEMNMATQLVEQLTAAFQPEEYTDEYRERLQALIHGKITGDEVKIAKEVPQTDITNLMDALQESIAETKPKKTKKTKKTSKQAAKTKAKQTNKRKTKTKKKETG